MDISNKNALYVFHTESLRVNIAALYSDHLL